MSYQRDIAQRMVLTSWTSGQDILQQLSLESLQRIACAILQYGIGLKERTCD